jgi:hypothetical protein
LVDNLSYSWIRPALEANIDTRKTFEDINLTQDEHDALNRLKTIPEFLNHVRYMEKKHRSDNGDRGFQGIMSDIGSFAQTYGCIVDALKQAPPFGAGQIAFGLFDIAITVSYLRTQSEGY